MTIGDRIKKARIAQKLSLEALGVLLGVSRQLVWQWEKGDSDPRKHVEALSKHLKVNVQYFYGEQHAPDILAEKISLLSHEQQELIHMMVDKMLGQIEPPNSRKSNVK